MNFRPLLAKLSRYLLIQAVDSSLRHGLPAIYRRLDIALPFWIEQHLSKVQMEGVIAQTVSDVLGRSPAPYELALVRLLYDPALAASNAVMIRSRP